MFAALSSTIKRVGRASALDEGVLTCFKEGVGARQKAGGRCK